MSSNLVTVADLPGQGVNLAAVSAYARTLGSAGAGIEAGTAQASATWLRVPAAYESTGTDSLYSAMHPVAEQGHVVHVALAGAAKALNAYVDAAGPVLAKVAQLRTEVDQFGTAAATSYPKPATDYNSYTSAGGAGAAPQLTYASWDEDPTAIATNQGLAARAKQLADELLNLQTECASAIRSAAGGNSGPQQGAPGHEFQSNGRVSYTAGATTAAKEGCAGSTSRTLGGLLHDGFADVTHGVSGLLSDTADAAGLAGAAIPRAWWNAESWVTGTLAPAAGLAGTMMLHWGSDRAAEAIAFQRSMNQAMFEHPDETIEMALGVLGMIGGTAMEAGGVALDITVVGAPAGVALNVSGAGVIAAGAATASLGAGQLASHALTDDRVDPQYNEIDPKTQPHPVYEGRSRAGTFNGNGTDAKNLERKGLDEVDEVGRYDEPIIRDQLKATVKGSGHGRFFDGLAKKPNGEYEGVEIKSRGASRDAQQREFDGLISEDNPAYVTLKNGDRVKITSVYVKKGVTP